MYAYLVALAFAAAIGFRDTLWDLPYSLPIIALLSVSIALVGRHWRSLSEMPVSTYALLAATALPYLTLLWSAWKPMTLWISLPLATAPAVILVGKEILGESDKWQTARRLVRLTGFAFSGFVLFDYFLTARRSDGLWHDANAAAALINALLIPYLITFITDTKSNKARTSPAIAILLLSAALFSTFSRGATLSFTISLAGFFVLAFVFRIPLTWRNAVASLAAVALGYTIVAALGPETGIERLTRDIGSDNSVKARLLMWESTLELYRQAPLAGHGIGSYKLLYPSVRSPEETQSSGDFAHNDYAQLLAEGGPFLAAMPIALGIWLSLSVVSWMIDYAFMEQFGV